jgi:hypothetical protein
VRKVLIIIIIILLLALGYNSVVKGITIGNFHISSVKEIEEQSKNLKSKIEELNSLIDVSYPKKISELKEANNTLQTTKEKYLKETNLSSNEEIISAMQTKSYDIERLWTVIGNHTDGVNIKLVFSSSSSAGIDDGYTVRKDITFTVNGTYIAITNFIYAIEDDDELDFRINNFTLSPYENNILQATFVVNNVRITSSSLNESISSNTTSTTTTTESSSENTTN